MNLSDKVNLSNFKLFVFDIDGTLMGKDHIIHSFTKKTLFRLRVEGYPFTLATGKNMPATISQADELEVDLPVILINGGMVQTRSGRIISELTLPETVTRKAIEICDARYKDLVIYIGDGIYFKKMNENIFPVYGHLNSGLHAVGEWEAIEEMIPRANKCLVVDSFEPMKLIEMGNVFDDTFRGDVDVLHTSTVLVELMPKGINKVTGIRALAESMGISMDAIMAFGDYDNDVEMLSSVGLGVAVENASPSAKAAADIVIGSVSEQGPAVFLKELLDRQSGR